MTAWNRRMAAATRVREVGDTDLLDERLRSMGIPAGLHPDDVLAVGALLRLAESRGIGFGTTILSRITSEYEQQDRQVRIVILGNETGVTTLVGDADDEMTLDALTGLPGRHHLLDTVDEELQAALGKDHSVGVFSIDIDRFKTLNDSQGFSHGDKVLRTLAASLADALRPEDTLARLGGDEFTICCPEIFGIADAMTLAERFRAVCSDVAVDHQLAGLTLSVGASVGGADRTSEELLREAETALYQAKGLGRDRCEIFDEDLRTRAERRITVDQRLRRALDEDGIQVHYQPILSVATRRIVGVEALLRIVGDDGNHLNPRELIEAAEDGGLIRRIEETVLQRAATTIRELSHPEREPLFLSVNVSDRQLADSRYPLALARTLNAVDFPAEHLHLEINRAILERKGAAIRLVTQLRALGVGVDIDEFSGSTDSELVVPDGVDVIKLDRRLVHGVHGERGRARAELVIDGIRDRKIDVCAVGVETEDDFRVIAELGCTYAQGYLFSPPVDARQLVKLIKSAR